MPPNTSASHNGSVNNDPHAIEERFLEPHQQILELALNELQNGCKESCWSWYFLPTPPHLVDGVERGSPMNQKYALRSDDQVHAFLEFARGDVSLRRNYIEIVTAIRQQLQHGLTLRELLGPMDAPKAISSFHLFERIGLDRNDTELYTVCGDVLEICGEERRPVPSPPHRPEALATADVPVTKRPFSVESLFSCCFRKHKTEPSKDSS